MVGPYKIITSIRPGARNVFEDLEYSVNVANKEGYRPIPGLIELYHLPDGGSHGEPLDIGVMVLTNEEPEKKTEKRKKSKKKKAKKGNAPEDPGGLDASI